MFMTPLDLSVRPPRGPRVLLGGFPMLARMIDRTRSRLPGGNPGAYIPLAAGLSGRIFDAMQIDPDDFAAAVASARTDDDVLTWLEGRVGRAGIAAATQPVAESRVCDIPPEHRPFVESLYPADLMATCDYSFDLLEADDSRTFGAVTTTATA
jgi:hypothetical protein